jgi:hypothetical protein
MSCGHVVMCASLAQWDWPPRSAMLVSMTRPVVAPGKRGTGEYAPQDPAEGESDIILLDVPLYHAHVCRQEFSYLQA